MKKIFLLFFISVVSFTTHLSAQRYPSQRYWGQWNMNIAGSYTPEGYGVRLGVEKAIGYSCSAIRSEFAFMNYRLDIPWLSPSQYLPSYTLQIGYVYGLNKNIPHVFNFNPSVGLLSGIETFRGDLPEGVVRMSKRHFLLGCYFLVQAEIILTPYLSVYVEPCGIFRLQTAGNRRDFTASLGLKFYIPR